MNKKSKRILSLLMSLIMVLSMFTGLNLSSFASGAEIVINYPEEFSVGDTITVTVSGVNTTGLESADISFYYDAECFEFVSINNPYGLELGAGGLYCAGRLYCAGQINWAFYFNSCATGDIDIAEITFNVLNAGDSEFKAVCTSSSGISLPSESAFEISGCDHNYEVAEIFAPTCIEQGHTKYVCTMCADMYNDDFVDVTDEHNYEATETVEPVCGDDGYTKYSCYDCGDSYYDYITATESHDYEEIEYVEGTCLADGYTLYKCTKCGDEYTSTEWGYCAFENGSLNCKYCGEYIFTYEISNGEVKIINCYADASGEVIIPDEIENCPVTTIGYKTFDSCNKITKIIIPASVTTIENDIFKNCFNIKYIEVDEGNEYFSNDEYGVLFNKDKTQLIQYPAGRSAEIYIVPDGVVLISSRTENTLSQNLNARDAWTPWGAFYGCDDLEKLVIPSTVTAICDEESYSEIFEEYRDRTFDECRYLEMVIIYSKNVDIHDQNLCMKYNYNTEQYEPVEDSVIYGYAGTAVEQYAKDNNITFIEISDDLISNLYYEIEDGEVTITGFKKSILGDIVIPDTIEGYPVTKMQASSYDEDGINFKYCPMLTGITVPDTVEIISGSFYGCYSLENINLGDNIKSLCDFYGTGFAENDANWENDLLYIGKYLVGARCKGKQSNTVKDGTVLIASGVFHSVSCSCKKIILPDSLKIIGNYSFDGALCLEEIIIPDSVTEIGSWAFNYCPFLKKVVLSKGLKEIKDYTFNKCTSLEDVIIPDGVTVIGTSAFAHAGVKNDIPDSVIEIGKNAFYYCNIPSEITIGENVKKIGSNAFHTIVEKFTVLSKDVEIGWRALGYVNSDTTNDGYALLDGVEIHGYAGSTAEAYAKENGIEFVVLEEPTTQEPTTQEPTTQETTTQEPTTQEPTTQEPTTQEPTTQETTTQEPTTQEPTTNEPTTEEPTTQEPSTEKPVENGELDVKDDSGIDVNSENKTALIGEESRVADITSAIENDSFKVLDKNGNELAADALIGTGCKIQILGADGNILAEYTVIVPNDVDGNAKVNAADARLALRAGAKLDVIDELCYFTAADADGNGKINAADARKILRKAAVLE